MTRYLRLTLDSESKTIAVPEERVAEVLAGLRERGISVEEIPKPRMSLGAILGVAAMVGPLQLPSLRSRAPKPPNPEKRQRAEEKRQRKAAKRRGE